MPIFPKSLMKMLTISKMHSESVRQYLSVLVSLQYKDLPKLSFNKGITITSGKNRDLLFKKICFFFMKFSKNFFSESLLEGQIMEVSSTYRKWGIP